MPFKRYRLKCLPFSLTISHDIFHQNLDTVFSRIKNVMGVMDDILVTGSTEEEHDSHDLEDQGSIPGQVIPKIKKTVLHIPFLNTQDYKVCIKGKVEQTKERSSALHLGVVAIEKGTFALPSIIVANNLYHLVVFFYS